QVALFNSVVALLLNLWCGKQLGLATDPVRDMKDIDKCLTGLRYYESRCVAYSLSKLSLMWHFRWQIAGRMWFVRLTPYCSLLRVMVFGDSDIISELISVGNAATPPMAEFAPRSSKRPHQDDD
ncbi:hypothetical protein BT96DRAFT_815273, partial [Gymnopus androsaceus JB14]